MTVAAQALARCRIRHARRTRSRAKESRTPQGAARTAVLEALARKAQLSRLLGGSSSGRTTDSDSVYLGSNPSPPANEKGPLKRRALFCCACEGLARRIERRRPQGKVLLADHSSRLAVTKSQFTSDQKLFM